MDEILKRFPIIGCGDRPQSLTDSEQDHTIDRQLLEESLAARKREIGRYFSRLFNDSGRLVWLPDGYRLTLKVSEVHGLLQVLNDVRVGLWHRLGSPDAESMQNLKSTGDEIREVWIMELCAYFQMELLEALNGES